MQENQNTTYSSAHLQALRSNRTPHYVWNKIDYDLPVKGNNTEELYRISDDWLQRLKILRCVYTEINSADQNSFAAFTKYLIENQRVQDKAANLNADGSWAIPEDVDMESDMRIDFVYFPSYIATAFLCLVKQKLPSIADGFPNFDEVLKKGLDFCARRNLQGHGYGAAQESLVAIEYLSLGEVFSFTQESPNISIKFNRATDKARDAIKSKLKDNRGWSSIDEDRAVLSLKLLDGNDVDDQLVCDSPNSYWKSKEREAIISELVDETLLIIASRFVPEMHREISAREIELLGVAEGVRPTHAVFKRAGREAWSDDIKLNAELNLPEVVDELRLSVQEVPLLLLHVNSKEYMDELSARIVSELHQYIDSRDVDNDVLAENHVRARVCKGELSSDTIQVYIVLSVQASICVA